MYEGPPPLNTLFYPGSTAGEGPRWGEGRGGSAGWCWKEGQGGRWRHGRSGSGTLPGPTNCTGNSLPLYAQPHSKGRQVRRQDGKVLFSKARRSPPPSPKYSLGWIDGWNVCMCSRERCKRDAGRQEARIACSSLPAVPVHDRKLASTWQK